MNVVRFCRENRYAVYLLTAFLTIAGIVSVFQLPSNIYPELNFPRIVILAHSGDLAPDTMLLTVTRPDRGIGQCDAGRAARRFEDDSRQHGNFRSLPAGRGHAERTPTRSSTRERGAQPVATGCGNRSRASVAGRLPRSEPDSQRQRPGRGFARRRLLHPAPAFQPCAGSRINPGAGDRHARSLGDRRPAKNARAQALELSISPTSCRPRIRSHPSESSRRIIRNI